jgi:O-antigen/teichoic acid export membrane protein
MDNSHHSQLRWSYASTLTTVSMQLVASATITRFLQPSDYGLAALATLCYSMTGYFTQLGMGRAMVQKPALTNGNIRAAFWLALLTGVVGFLALASFSPLLALYFREPHLTPIIIVFGLNLIFQSASMVSGGLLKREFRIRDLAICDFLGYFISTFGIGLPMAIMGCGVWALVGSNVSQALIVATAYFIARPHSLLPTVDRINYRHITGFSSKATITTSIEALAGGLDTIILGHLVSPSALGIYNRGMTLSTMPGYNISQGLTRVYHPTIARAAECNLTKCHGILVASERNLMSLIIPFCAGAAVAAPTVIPTIFGSQWISAVPIYQMLCIAAAFDASFHLPSIQLEILGLFRNKFIMQLFYTFVFGVGIIIVAPKGGVLAVSILLAACQALRSLVLHHLSARSLGVSIFSIIGSWVPGIVCASAVSLPLYLAQSRLAITTGLPPVLRLIMLLFLSLAMLLLAYRFLYRRTIYESWMLLFRRVR